MPAPDDFVLLDTDVFIALTRGKRSATLYEPLVAGRLLVLTDGMTHTWARITDAARRAGRALGQKAQAHDAWIAAAAIHHELPLLTGNVRHFDGVDGLDLVHSPASP